MLIRAALGRAGAALEVVVKEFAKDDLDVDDVGELLVDVVLDVGADVEVGVPVQVVEDELVEGEVVVKEFAKDEVDVDDGGELFVDDVLDVDADVELVCQCKC